MTTLPLDVDDLIGELGGQAAEFERFPTAPPWATFMKVASIPETVAFDRIHLGFS